MRITAYQVVQWPIDVGLHNFVPSFIWSLRVTEFKSGTTLPLLFLQKIVLSPDVLQNFVEISTIKLQIILSSVQFTN